jgi:4-hydroxyphenylpyruvate dioxygenase
MAWLRRTLILELIHGLLQDELLVKTWETTTDSTFFPSCYHYELVYIPTDLHAISKRQRVVSMKIHLNR